MLATPRLALLPLPLLPLLLLHVPHAARAQVNPGKSDRDQVAAGAVISFLLPDGQVRTRIVSIISGTFSALGAVCDGPPSLHLPGHSAVLHLTWAPAVTCRAPSVCHWCCPAPGSWQDAGHGKALQPEPWALSGALPHGGSLSLEAAKCQAIVFSAGLCLLCQFCSKPRLALVKWLDGVPPGFCLGTTTLHQPAAQCV